MAAHRVATALVLAFAACASAPQLDPRYRPAESVVEVVAALRLHIDDDTYRRPAERDFTGKNIYRASFSRLENLEERYADKFRSGYMLDVLYFSKARALERIGEFDLCEKTYRRVARLESTLARDAGEGVRVCGELARADRLYPSPGSSVETALDVFRQRVSVLSELLASVEETHFAHPVREELERTDLLAARYFAARSRLEPGLQATALQAFQTLVQNHPESKNHNRNLLELARFYEELARNYTLSCRPVGLCFEPATFDEYVFGASQIYESVARQDGAIEKVEAGRRYEALLAFVLEVYGEKLPGDSPN